MNFTFEAVIEMWKQDSTINQTAIPNELCRSPLLHSKYLEIYMYTKAKLISSEKNYNKMKWKRRVYYKGEMTQDELIAQGWDQYQGLKLSSAEFNALVEYDTILTEYKEKVEYYNSFVKGIEYILKQIQSRDWILRTLVDFNKFSSGG